MARVPRRRRRSVVRHRRSREERRRLSEGGGGSTPHPPPSAEEPNPGLVPQIEMQRLTDKEIEMAYQTVFQFDEKYENILVEQSFYECEIEKLLALKCSADDKLSKLKLTTKDPDSDNIRLIRSVMRRTIELEESIDVVKMELSEIRLRKIEVEAHFKSSISIINQHVVNEDDEESLLLGCLAYVLMME